VAGDVSRIVDIGDKSFNGYERNVLFRNLGPAGGDTARGAAGAAAHRFVDAGHVSGADRIEDGRAVGAADFDLDGDLDLVIQNHDNVSRLLINHGEKGNWLELRLQGTRSNRDAVGARVRIRHGARTQTREVHCGAGHLSSHSLVVHFGLGAHDRADEVTIDWPSGVRQALADIRANQRLHVTEPEPWQQSPLLQGNAAGRAPGRTPGA
jgi:hypothetical protein